MPHDKILEVSMPRKATALHVVEKGEEFVNLKCINKDQDIWESGNWKVADSTAETLIGGMIYVHKGQYAPSHIGGEVISFRSSEDTNRKIFTFKALKKSSEVLAGRAGWGNEKKIIWDGVVEEEFQLLDEEDESAFPEGVEYYTLHKERERDKAFSDKVKLVRIEKMGKLECDVCSFDFAAIFGSLGAGYIEAHHTIPVSQLDKNTKTKVSDLALVCSNCHRMLHRGKNLLTVSELKALRQDEA